MANLTLKVIVVSTRPGRQGRIIGDWFADYAQRQGSFTNVELVDLAEVNLPIFDEPNHPMARDYKHDHTKQWSKIIDEADAYAIILPEYNYFAPPSIINAIDYLHHEWKYKAAGIVSYGGVSAGTRAAQSLKPLLTSASVMPLPQGIMLPFFKQFIDEETDTFKENDLHREAADTLLTELAKWADALKTIRG